MESKNLDIDAVGFDLDNTLYTQTPEIEEKIQDYIYEKSAAILGKPKEEVKKAFQARYAVLQSASRSLTSIGILSIDAAKEIVQTSLEEADVASVLKKDDRLVEMLQKLSQNHKLFLITGSKEQLSYNKLHALGINEAIFNPRLYAGSEYKRHDGTAFHYVSSSLGIPFRKMMFVGDREKVDIIPATELGIRTAIVNAKSEKATYQLQSIYDLESILT